MTATQPGEKPPAHAPITQKGRTASDTPQG